MSFPFETLGVWRKSIVLCSDLYRVVDSWPANMRFSLADQVKRAASSVPANIAEGAGRYGSADKRRFYVIARGSVFEIASHLQVATEARCLTDDCRIEYWIRLEELAKMLNGLIQGNSH